VPAPGGAAEAAGAGGAAEVAEWASVGVVDAAGVAECAGAGEADAETLGRERTHQQPSAAGYAASRSCSTGSWRR
jgi:hypothetical protein